jgi:putative nucleotidyltransferase with HDIG domain
MTYSIITFLLYTGFAMRAEAETGQLDQPRAEYLDPNQLVLDIFPTEIAQQFISLDNGNVWEHSKRVQYGVYQLTHELGWDAKTILLAQKAALLHDTGKMAIHDLPNYSSSKIFNFRDHRKMDKHTSFGRNLLQLFACEDIVVLTALLHHDTNSSIFSESLTQQEQKVVSVIAVVDIMDALADKERLYRKPSVVPEILLGEINTEINKHVKSDMYDGAMQLWVQDQVLSGKIKGYGRLAQLVRAPHLH